jgi:hypothetical protein
MSLASRHAVFSEEKKRLEDKQSLEVKERQGKGNTTECIQTVPGEGVHENEVSLKMQRLIA